MKKEFYIGKTQYSIDDDNQGFQGIPPNYYKYFKIFKDNTLWSGAEVGITDQVITGWRNSGEQVDIERFIVGISSYIIKAGIYNNEIKEGKEAKKFLLCKQSGKTQEENLKFLSVCSSETQTVEYYRKQATEIDTPRIGFR